MKKLSALALPTLPEGVYPDTVVTGLKLRVGKKRRTWQLRYLKGDQQPTHTLGYYIPHAPTGTEGHLTLGEARETAKQFLDRLEYGIPLAAAPKVEHPKNALTLDGLFKRYERMRELRGDRIKSLPRSMQTLRLCLADYLQMPAARFSKSDLREARDKVAARAPQQSSAMLRCLGPVLRWASQEDLIVSNFVPEVLKVASVVKRDNVLTDDQLAAIWHAAGAMEGRRGDAAKNFGRMVRLLMLTGQRRDEAASLKHGDILDGVWRQIINKSDRPFRIPLTAMALEVIGEGTARDLVFAGVRGKISGFSRLKADLDELSGVEGWVLHDLRRSLSSKLKALGTRRGDIDFFILNHSATGAGAHYFFDSEEGEDDTIKRAIFQKWADHIAKIIARKQMLQSNI